MKSLLLTLLALTASLLPLRAQMEPPKVPQKDTVARFGADVIDGLTVRKVRLIEDSDAITGIYASADRDYLVVGKAPLPEEGDPLSIWIRYRSLAIQMKTDLGEGDGKLFEFPWSWRRNANAFGWRKVGVFPRSELGSEVFFMGDNNLAPESGLDAIVITADESWVPTEP